MQPPGGGGEGHVERRGELANREYAASQPPEHVAPGLMGERLKHGIHLWMTFNHVVEHTTLVPIVNIHVECWNSEPEECGGEGEHREVVRRVLLVARRPSGARALRREKGGEALPFLVSLLCCASNRPVGRLLLLSA